MGRRGPAATAAGSERPDRSERRAIDGRVRHDRDPRASRLDAEVSIDGENWRAPGGQERLVVDVAEGSHTVEIRKTGFPHLRDAG